MLSVIGFPRTGFTLLISIIIELRALHNKISSTLLSAPILSRMDEFQTDVPRRIESLLRDLKLPNEIIFNANFHHPLGGPNWIDEERKTLCVRKYIGFKGLGDMTIIISLPLDFIFFHQLPHTHGPINPWVEKNGSEQVFHSIRGPAGTINSAVHSINALTSEYLQKWYPDQTPQQEETIRTGLAMAKLSDLNFFQAMVSPMRKSFEELVSFMSQVCIVKWEDIIANPIQTILRISHKLELETNFHQASAIWEKIGHRNLTQSHKHNYRNFSEKLTGHYNSLTNDHIEILKSNDFLHLAKELQVEPPSFMDSKNYNEIQKIIAQAIQHNQTIKYTKDEELYWLSFQKTNIDFTKFNFKVFDWKEHTKLERTNISNDTLANGIWNIFENSTRKMVLG